MPGPEQKPIQSHSEERSLLHRTVYVHNDHVQSGLATSASCGLCGTGLAGLYAAIEKVQPVDSEDGVVEGEGKDEKGDPPPAPDPWTRAP